MQLRPNIKGIVYLAVFLSVPIAVLVSVIRSKVFPSSSTASVEADLVLLLSTGLVAFLVWLIVAMAYTWGWRRAPRLFGVENLNGRWEGWYYRSLGGEICPTAHEILQETPLTISAQAFGWCDGQMNTSSSTIAAFAQKPGTPIPELIWAYETEGRTNDLGGTHVGTHVMTLVRSGEDRYLRGRYYNDRRHADGKAAGGWGRIWLKYTAKKPIGHIGNIDSSGRPEDWAISEVPDELLNIQKAMSKNVSPELG